MAAARLALLPHSCKYQAAPMAASEKNFGEGVSAFSKDNEGALKNLSSEIFNFLVEFW